MNSGPAFFVAKNEVPRPLDLTKRRKELPYNRVDRKGRMP